jgi:hypothetical protein
MPMSNLSIQRLPTGHSAPKFDLVFIDADKGNYINYFNQILSRSLLSDRGVMLVDNGKDKDSALSPRLLFKIILMNLLCSAISRSCSANTWSSRRSQGQGPHENSTTTTYFQPTYQGWPSSRANNIASVWWTINNPKEIKDGLHTV